MTKTRVAGSVAVVTGGASGIGRALAERFLAEGARAVVVADRTGAKSVAAELAAAATDGATALGLDLDVTDEVAVRAAIDRVDRELGPIDIYCSNAGIATGPDLG